MDPKIWSPKYKDAHILVPGNCEYVISSTNRKLIETLVPGSGMLLQKMPKNVNVALELDRGKA